MNGPRAWCGCTTIPSTEERNAQIVVVGSFNSKSTVEILDVSSNSWFNVAKIPFTQSLYGNSLTASNSPEYKLYSIGGTVSNGAIYGLTQSDGWVHVGNLTENRWYHTSLNVDKKDIPGCA